MRWGMATDPTNATRWKHKFGFQNRGIQWDTPVSKWAGEGKDWIQLMAQGPPCKEDVTHCLLASMRQAVEKRTKTGGSELTKKPRELAPLVLEIPVEDKRLMLEIRGDSRMVVDWVDGHSKLKTKESTIAGVQNFLRDWWGRGWDLRHRVAEWAIHIFREHNKEADSWAAKGVKGREGEWVDIASVVWSEVTGLCGFWDGSCENGRCGAGIMIQAFTKTLGWALIHKKVRPGAGSECSGCRIGWLWCVDG